MSTTLVHALGAMDAHHRLTLTLILALVFAEMLWAENMTPLKRVVVNRIIPLAPAVVTNLEHAEGTRSM
jgi:hypothetical protein